MLPVNLDLSRLTIGLIGRAGTAVRRLALLDEAGARHLQVWSDEPSGALRRAAGDRFRPGLPGADQIGAFDLVFIADLDTDEAESLVIAACAQRVLVNVEDVRPFCDFHSVSVVRRGDLVVGISTDGRCPSLARAVRLALERLFTPDWIRHVDRLGKFRADLKRRGAGIEALDRATAELAASLPEAADR